LTSGASAPTIHPAIMLLGYGAPATKQPLRRPLEGSEA
jgi:hypothetical protein